MKTDASGNVIATAEKRPISKQATVGLYYFRKAKDFLEGAEKSPIRNYGSIALRVGFRCEHYVTLRALDQPGRTGKRIRVRHVIVVVMRQREVSDIGGRVPDRRELWQQRLLRGASSHYVDHVRPCMRL